MPSKNAKPASLPKRPLVIAGPCVIESEAAATRIARELKEITAELRLPFIFKASYDKANRSSVKSFRGPGLKDGVKILGRIARQLGVRVTTDIHEPAHAKTAARHVDLLQIPAFLCRQTDLLLAAAATGRAVSVKKGQFLAPEDVGNIADKLRAGGCRDYYLIERGSSFGYRNLVVDMRGLEHMRRAGHRVIFDATHSVQRPGGLGTATGGDRTLAPPLARAAVAVGVEGIFLETHPNPDQSKSDGPNLIPLSQLPALLAKLAVIHEAAHG
ncbi:MAG: 3-deoxy-8-phosphooctulonate synthase [Verrucomicrobiota bacterium]